MRKNVALLFMLVLAGALFFACQDAALSGGSGIESVESLLPPDSVDDAPRVFSGNFTYETLLPVELDLGFKLYDPDQAGGNEPLSFDDPEEGTAPKIYITVKDQSENLLYSGAVAADKILEKTLYLPSAPKNIELTLEAEGFETRRVIVNNMSRFSVIRRTMSMMRESSSNLSLNVKSRGLGPMTDSDGDGVPDKYDLYPDDPDAAFDMSVPAAESITIAFEDLFGHKNAGDADYNDFIATYTINEIMNADSLITRIEVQAKALEKRAGYNHSFGIRIDSFTGRANLSGSFINRGGNSARLSGKPDAPAEIVLFDGTAEAKGRNAWFVLEFDEPQDPAEFSRPPYNPYLFVHNTLHDIHLIDTEPLKHSINPHDRFIDADGFPWALLIPADWEYPADGQRIEDVYPYFTDWCESSGMEYEDWYERSGDEPHPENLPPYPVIPAREDGNSSLPGFQAYFVPYTLATQFMQLEIAIVDGKADPDGDEVYFRSESLPQYMSLDENSGIITITGNGATPPAGLVIIDFWSEDSTGNTTEDMPFTVEFYFVSS